MTQKKQPLVIPFLDYCFIERPDSADGIARAIVEPRAELCNSMGMAHGGLVMTLLDCAMGHAARASLPGDSSVVTIDMQVAFLAPARGRLVAEARVVRTTRSFVFAEGEVRDPNGEIVSRATGLFRPVDRARMSAGAAGA